MKLLNVAKDWISTALGPFVINYYTKIHYNSLLVFTIETIGDRCLELSYLTEYKRINLEKNICILTRDAHNALYEYFPDSYDCIQQIPKYVHAILLRFYIRHGKNANMHCKFPQVLCMYYQGVIEKSLLEYSNCISIGDITKSILKLDERVGPADIKRKNSNSVIASYLRKIRNNSKKRIILINTVSVSYQFVETDFFELLSSKINRDDYVVFTNTINNQQPIKGTEAIRFSLNESIEVFDEIEYVIGVRSGFLDLASFSKANIVAIDNRQIGISDAYLLEKLWPNSSCKTFRIENDCNYDTLADSIIHYLK